MEYIAFDAHKRYTLASVVRPDGRLVREQRETHERGALRGFLERCERGSPVAVETIGNWYWIVDEIEAAGCLPRVVHARKAKLMLGEINKTDRLDVRGLNRLQQAGTLPTVWIPPGELRDQRDLPRTRMVLVRQRTQLKNRIHATLAKYALHDVEVGDLFGVRGRALLRQRLSLLPPHTAYATEQLLEQIEGLDRRVRGFEQRIQAVFEPTPVIDRIDDGFGDPRSQALYEYSELDWCERTFLLDVFGIQPKVTVRFMTEEEESSLVPRLRCWAVPSCPSSGGARRVGDSSLSCHRGRFSVQGSAPRVL